MRKRKETKNESAAKLHSPLPLPLPLSLPPDSSRLHFEPEIRVPPQPTSPPLAPPFKYNDAPATASCFACLFLVVFTFAIESCVPAIPPPSLLALSCPVCVLCVLEHLTAFFCALLFWLRSCLHALILSNANIDVPSPPRQLFLRFYIKYIHLYRIYIHVLPSIYMYTLPHANRPSKMPRKYNRGTKTC